MPGWFLIVTTMHVRMQNLTKRFGDTLALKHISLEIRSQELFFLLGPSGCGKTTLLRLLAGFYQPDSGQIFFGERPLVGVPPHRRNTGMVFQNYALWPHLSVAENVAYGLKARGMPGGERKTRVEEALATVQMEPYAQRTPNQLSGGQQQRVALARALVVRPDVLLLDEPLSNLDAKLRLEMREEIRRIQAETKITTIYVTHDQKEALSLADRLAVLRAGEMEQVGEPREIYRAPLNRFVADFIGESNWLEAEVQSSTQNEVLLRASLGEFRSGPKQDLVSGQKVWLGFRPEAVEIGAHPVNQFKTTVVHVSYLGEIEQYNLEIMPGQIIKAFEQNPLEIRRVGSALAVHVRPQDVLVLPRA